MSETNSAATIDNPATGSMEAVIDKYIEKRDAPEVDTAAAPSEAPEVIEAAPEVQSDEPELEITAEDLEADDAGDAEPQVEAQKADPKDQIVTIYPDGPEGEPVEATLEELQSSYMRQADYTRKTQEVAEQRRQAEAMSNEIMGQRQHYLQSIEAMAGALHQSAPPPPDPALQSEDPVAYLEQDNALRKHNDEMAKLHAEHQQASAQQQHTVIAQQEQALHVARNELVRMKPELTDPTKMTDFVTKNRAHLIKSGYSEEQANNIYDPLAVMYIDKARRYDELVAKSKGKIKQAPRNTVPSIRQSQAAGRPPATLGAVKKAETAHRKQGTVNSAIDLLHAQRAARQ